MVSSPLCWPPECDVTGIVATLVIFTAGFGASEFAFLSAADTQLSAHISDVVGRPNPLRAARAALG